MVMARECESFVRFACAENYGGTLGGFSCGVSPTRMRFVIPGILSKTLHPGIAAMSTYCFVVP
eukprot:scaffold22985_cov178-Amphora_coffeaeformis.AAC.2